MENKEVHVRASEVAATAAVALGKIVDNGKPEAARVRLEGVTVMTHHSQGSDGFANRVEVTDVMWSGGSLPTIVFVLANGQEFEAEVRPSSKAIREAKVALDCATQVAERAQDAAKAARKEV